MCGIAFSYNPDSRQNLLNMKMTQALQEMKHRGPDDSGIQKGTLWAVGHCRLSIIDLQASRQPMMDKNKRFYFAYNGETYNFKELRHSLKQRWNFQTAGDTETVMAGLIIEGPSFLQKMRGMWALSLWDSLKQKLLLARDRLGKKPLYFTTDNHTFSCASELNGLLKLSASSEEEDPNSAADYLRYGYYLPGTTIYKGVQEVLPGHYLLWSPDQSHEQHSFWGLAFGQFSGSKREAGLILQEKLVAAVRRRLVADVEVGAFLSGGIDSSLVVGILGDRLNVHPKTFTIGFSDKDFDERSYARLIVERFGTEHYEECVTLEDSNKLTDLVLNHVGQPFADSSLLPSAAVAGLASSHVKVALSGDGADELFSGYQRYQVRAILRWYTRLPSKIRKNLEKVIRAIPGPIAHHSWNLIKKAHLFLDIAQRHLDETPYVGSLMYSRKDFMRLVPDLAQMGHTPPNLPEQTRLDDIHAMMAADTLVYLPQDNLLKVDRASMSRSLEVRSPFVDHDIVEFAFSLPRSWHRSGLMGKKMLRDNFSDLLPARLWQRRKQGFAVPVHVWFRQGMETTLQELLYTSSTSINSGFVEQMIDEHKTCRRDHGYRLWNIYIYLLWRQQHMKRS